MQLPLDATLVFAQQKDKQDALHHFRSRFYFPQHNGNDAIYFCGNSLGLQPKNVEMAIQQELQDWRYFAVGGYLHAKNPWLYYQHHFTKPLSKIVGCKENEVTVMNTLTVNLHLMMLSFYHPTRDRYKIMIDTNKTIKMRRLLIFFVAIFSITTIVAFGITKHSGATSAAGFNAGRIIDDAIFTNSNSMSVAQIQTFLNSKVTSCDTNGTQVASDFGSGLMQHIVRA